MQTRPMYIYIYRCVWSGKRVVRVTGWAYIYTRRGATHQHRDERRHDGRRRSRAAAADAGRAHCPLPGPPPPRRPAWLILLLLLLICCGCWWW